MRYYCPQCYRNYDDEQFDTCPEDGARLYALSDKRDDPLLGTVVDDRFRIEEILGEGGMGAVYKATQLSVHRAVALKILRPDLEHEELFLERFFREARVIAELSHPNIVRLIDFGQDRQSQLLFLVMELVKGTDMAGLLKQGRLALAMALDVVYQVCAGLTEPHSRGIVHRDLKPDNIILLPISDGSFQVKLLDFGIARTADVGTGLTQTGMLCGTPAYMSPEQAQNEAVTPQTDLYSLGVILFEMLTGHLPFEAVSGLQLLMDHVQRPAPQLELSYPWAFPDEVSSLVSDLLAKRPDARPASAREVRRRVQQIRKDLDLPPVVLAEDPAVRSGPYQTTPFAPWLLPSMAPDNPGQPQLTAGHPPAGTASPGADGEADSRSVDPTGATALAPPCDAPPTAGAMEGSQPSSVARASSPGRPDKPPTSAVEEAQPPTAQPPWPRNLRLIGAVVAAIGVVTAVGLLISLGVPGGDDAEAPAPAADHRPTAQANTLRDSQAASPTLDHPAVAALDSPQAIEQPQPIDRPSPQANGPADLFGGEVYEGMLMITSAAEAEAAKSFREVTGGLTIHLESPSTATIELPNLEFIGGPLTITRQSGLQSLSLPSLERLGGILSILQVDDGFELHTPHLGTIEEGLSITGTSLSSLEIGGLRQVQGMVILTNNQALESLTLPHLESIEGQFSISDSPNLSRLTAPRLRHIGDQLVFTDLGLTMLSFDGLQTLGGGLTLNDIDNLQRLSFASLTSVGMSPTSANGHFLIAEFPNLVDLQLPRLQQVKENLAIVNTPQITRLDLGHLEAVGGQLNLTNNQALQRINLAQLTEVGDNFTINNNRALHELTVDHLQSADQVRILNNHRLSNCTVQAIIDHLQAQGWLGRSQVRNNLDDC